MISKTKCGLSLDRPTFFGFCL